MPGRHTHLMLLVAAVCFAAITAGCSKADKTPVLGTAFAGPVTLELREEISPASKTVASAKHGELLDILQIRRRFVRVRTPSGQQGWTDSRHLLSSKQMDELAALANHAQNLPSQGEATSYAALNVHTEPARLATSFYQIQEGIHVEVVAHRLLPRSQPAPPAASSLDLKKPAAPPPRRRKKKEPDYPPPPAAPAPGLPPEWLELSKNRLPEPPPPPPEDPTMKRLKRRVKPRPTGPPMEDWTLVRTQDGKAGWVLSRMLVMAIPDEVAQYAEGARITSYFALGEVNDDGLKKNHWLWTTIRDNAMPYQYDSFRVFTYVVKRHRYETAYIERNIEGYYPSEVTPGALPKFSLVLRGADGQLYKKTWVMEGYMVRKVAEEPYVPVRRKAGAEQEQSMTDRLRNLLTP